MASSWTNPAPQLVVVQAARATGRARLVLGAHEVNPVSQIFRERMTLEAIDNGTRRLYRQSHLSRMVFPQELPGARRAGRWLRVRPVVLWI